MFWIKRLMKEYKIKTYHDFSQRTGLSLITINTISRRKVPPQHLNFWLICAIAEGLSITLDELKDKLEEYERLDALAKSKKEES